MASPRLLAAATVLAAGCSLVYDVDDLRPRDAATIDAPDVDAIPIDAIPIDVDPTMLTIEEIDPPAVHEGVGADGGRPALFVVEGDSISGDIAVTAELLVDGGDPIAIAVEDLHVAATGRRLAFALRIPVIEGFGATDPARTLRVTFVQAEVTRTLDVEVLGLAELTLAGGVVAQASLAQRYSRITVTGDTRFTGSQPVRLRATAGVTIGELLRADAVNQTPGPHGCGGGRIATAGDCGSGGGRAGGSSTVGSGGGGGGGGFGAEGTAGAGSTDGPGGDPGMPTGNDMLVPLVTASGPGNRGNGGGGGGTGTLGSGGGLGGGGGGVIEVVAGGNLVVEGAGAIRSRGGPGAGSGGTGGGGSGGAILVRAGGAIVSNGAWLSAPGGDGGGDTNSGGDGGLGRIRVDSATGPVTGMGTTPVPVAGPAWDVAAPRIVADVDVTLTLRGDPGREHGLIVNGTAVRNETIGIGGTRQMTVTLEAGRNTVCAAWRRNGEATHLAAPEATSCIEIVVAR